MLSIILLELTLQEVIANIPRDPGAIIAYALLAVFLGFIWTGRSRKEPPPQGSPRTRSTR